MTLCSCLRERIIAINPSLTAHSTSRSLTAPAIDRGMSGNVWYLTPLSLVVNVNTWVLVSEKELSLQVPRWQHYKPFTRRDETINPSWPTWRPERCVPTYPEIKGATIKGAQFETTFLKFSQKPSWHTLKITGIYSSGGRFITMKAGGEVSNLIPPIKTDTSPPSHPSAKR